LLGTPREPDLAAAEEARLRDAGRSLEEVIPALVQTLDGMPIWGHPRSQVNVIGTPSIASLLGVILPSLYNPNLCSEESGRGFTEAEVRAASITADLVGYDARQAGGVFTFGGTGTLLYGVKIGLEKACPGTHERGFREDAVILCSEQAHYACLSVAAWLGLGQQHVLRVPSRLDNSIDLPAFERVLRETLDAKRKIAAVVATMGTTDAFGIDDLAGMHGILTAVAKEYALPYTPHLHADAVIGWAWSAFRGYDFAANPQGFRGRTVRALAAAWNRLQHLALADSLGVDFHKTGFAPYISSLFLLKDRTHFGLLSRDKAKMPYLFHSGNYHPGMFTLETSRAATGVMSAWANMLFLGRDGFRALIGHIVEMAESLRELVVARPELSVLNEQNVGPVTLIRAYPDGVDTFRVKERERTDPAFRDQLLQYNQLNRRIYQHVHAEALAGRGVAIGFTENYRTTDYGEPINALKSYVLSPFADETQMQAILGGILAGRERVLETR
jgi:glutamate/tyrosine decarboxylase-like PLP-dependent enzyme